MTNEWMPLTVLDSGTREGGKLSLGQTFDLCILLNDSEYFTTYIVISWFSTKAVYCNGRSIRPFLYTPAKCKKVLSGVNMLTNSKNQPQNSPLTTCLIFMKKGD